jgi:outer membrane protein W
MLNRTLRAAAVAAALALTTAPAFAAQGTWSLGANFGLGTYSNGELNDALNSTGIKEVKDGWEYGGTLRYGLSPKTSLELEGMSMNGKSTTTEGTTSLDVHTKALGLPVNFLYALSQNETHDFNLLIGAGPMLNTKITTKLEDTGSSSEDNSASKTAFMAQGGFEGDYLLSRQFALSARVLGRFAKADNVDVDSSDPSAGNIDINMSGFAASLGMRVFF